MARTLAELPKGARITDFVSLGVLTEKFPRTTIDRILQETGRASKRERNLPAHGQVGDYSGPEPSGERAVAAAVPGGGGTHRDQADAGGVVSGEAAGDVGRQHAGSGRHSGQ